MVISNEKNKLDLKPIPDDFSIYLDVLRVCAALFVMLFHIKKLQIGPPEILKLIPDHGHDAVILFFVLSGYVIAATADRKYKSGFREYILDRASRVYSVAIPALLISMILAFFFQDFLQAKSEYAVSQVLRDTLINLFFLGQSWSLNTWVYYNQPYWSLSYEVMFYIGFGIFTFASGRMRWIGIILIALIAGPKILLLLPCWVAGVVAYRMRDSLKLRQSAAFLVAFVVPVMVLLVLNKIGFGTFIRQSMVGLIGDQKDYLQFSVDFPIDYMTALLCAINLYAARFVRIPYLTKFKKLASSAAASSFTLYLVHLPIIFVISNLFHESSKAVYVFLLTAFGIPLICHFLALLTEHRRFHLRALLDRLTPG